VRVDASVLRKRQEEIKETVRESSAVLVWPLDSGILMVAANKSAHDSGNRIYAVHDRMALSMRGEYSASRLLAHKTIDATYLQIIEYGPEEVDPSLVLGVLGNRLAESYEMPVGPQVKAEAVLVRLETAPADDFIGLAECSGETERIEGPLWRGSDEKGDRQEALQQHLSRLWVPDQPLPEVLTLLATDGVLNESLKPRVRLESVFMDRNAMLRKEWTRIIRRLP
jgi:hypothetical protein